MRIRKICLILCLMLISSSLVVNANDLSSNYAVKNSVIETIMEIEGEQVNVYNPIKLYNKDLQEAAISFDVSGGGYIIYDTNDGKITEYSLKKPSPFNPDYKGKYIYIGPLNYYKYNDVSKTNLRKVQNTYNMNSRKNPPTWGSPYYCGVDGSAIMLMYWDDYNDDFVETANESDGKLQKYLVDNNYLYNRGLSGSDIVNGEDNTTTGISQYISDRGLSDNYGIRDKSYSFSTVKSKVDLSYILLAGTDSETGPGPDGKYNNHWIIVYDYKDNSGSSSDYLVINDGWGNDGINVSADEKYYPFGLVYIYYQS